MARIKGIGELNLGSFGYETFEYHEFPDGSITVDVSMTIRLDQSVGQWDELILYAYDQEQEFLINGERTRVEERLRTPKVIRAAVQRLVKSWKAEGALSSTCDIVLYDGHDPDKELVIKVGQAQLDGKVENPDRLLQSIARKLNRYIAQASR